MLKERIAGKVERGTKFLGYLNATIAIFIVIQLSTFLLSLEFRCIFYCFIPLLDRTVPLNVDM